MWKAQMEMGREEGRGERERETEADSFLQRALTSVKTAGWRKGSLTVPPLLLLLILSFLVQEALSPVRGSTTSRLSESEVVGKSWRWAHKGYRISTILFVSAVSRRTPRCAQRYVMGKVEVPKAAEHTGQGGDVFCLPSPQPSHTLDHQD